MQHALKQGAIGVILLSVAACAGGPPPWVQQGAFVNPQSKAFYGVGSVTAVHNEAFAWDIAENRARAMLAKTFDTYTGYLMRDYAASTTAGDLSKNAEEQTVERAIKTVTLVTVTGAQAIARYKDETSHTYYVMVKLPVHAMTDSLFNAKELNKELREYVRKNAERVFERLEKEEAKQGLR